MEMDMADNVQFRLPHPHLGKFRSRRDEYPTPQTPRISPE